MQQHALAEFHGISVSIIDHAGKRWLTAEQVGLCLGYAEANARDGILKLHSRHWDEFTESDTCAVKLTAQGQMREMRIFSDTGCHLLGFFSATPRAKEFRAWAKQVLVGQTAVPPAPTSRGRPLVATRRLERQAFELFVAGYSQKQIAGELKISVSLLNAMLHAKYRFSPAAGAPECSEELIAAVADRHLEIQQAALTAMRERIAQKFCAHACNQPLADALDEIGNALQAIPEFALLEGGAA